VANKIVVVTGTPGVGKSTVVAQAIEKLRSAGTEYEFVNYGDFMLTVAKQKAGVTDRDQMRKLPWGVYREIQKKAAEDIARVAERKPVLLDTHCTVKKPEGYYPGLPKWVLERLQPESIIIIEAPAQEVLGRRSKDAGRRRDKEVLTEIEEHQQLNRAVAMAYAAFTGAAVRIIVNRDGKLNDAVNEMVEALR